MTIRRRVYFALVLVAIGPFLLAMDLGGVAADGVVRWTDFTWHHVSANGRRLEKAALLLPATIAGLPGTHAFQLDTGSHLNFLHGGAISDVNADAAAKLVPSPSASDAAAALTGTVAGASMTGEPFTVIPAYRAIFTRGEPTPVIGTIGLRFLERRVLVIDYPGTRVALLDAGNPLPPAISRKTKFFPLDYRNGKIYVPVTLDGQASSQYFFDTGSSLFPLMTTRDEWRRLTGREPEAPGNVRYTVPSWNDVWMETIGAPMLGQLGVGPVTAKAPMVFFINDARFQVDRMPNTRGIIGNALIAADHAIVIDLPGRRIGFIRSKDLARE